MCVVCCRMSVIGRPLFVSAVRCGCVLLVVGRCVLFVAC